MRIGIPDEAPETRAAATPATVTALLTLGYDVVVQAGAGARSSFPDHAYRDAGAAIGTADDVWSSDVVAMVGEPSPAQQALMRPGQVLIGFLHPRSDPALIEALAARGVTALSMDMVPRISRAQSLDALSSMANIAGYRAVIEAGHAFGRFFTGQVTAAGKVPPAKVFVIGTGVAGLAAIGAAGGLGAEVTATDVRPETAEQVESMGAKFVKVAEVEEVRSSDGYARDTSADYAAKAAELYARQAATVDIIITTAAIPGRPSPKLITAEMVESMRPGSVIVDLAAAGGGNCVLTRPGETYTTDGGVTIVGYTDLASRLPGQASQLYGTNIVNLLKLLTPDKDGELRLDFDDVVHRQMTVVRDGEVTFPPPPIEVSVAPAAAAAPAPVAIPTAAAPPDQWARFRMVLMLVAGWLLLSLLLPGGFLSSILVFGLAMVVGYYVIWGVEPALYTPLMSVSNAVSGITIVGAITQLTSPLLSVQIIAFVAIVLAGINCVGGFAITNRMLAMFKRS
ncbi:NAD(P) transhydrogenase subunit alpha [Tessaracoccus lapidicaptus]|uniref:NAD(P) transhydrogenase subunit alpha n=1 Tax=Tessaracoccus lapidicaptus TaxID=1427523 RepID=A0A1C0AR82_9ACTN|nr:MULTISPECIES: Re/Si-specific NAD(P)(+) transhydrogenase subunit alpha [Tessaracoccus]AQX15047.1 NAD(P) transhydrogenase subunit alpha [Tessaracoccus sp. T2.5-30]OCL36877.1 NAD(P) transhydrogenase subunit alpha [Tessaracoccus lapidicaptus]VEP39234.1 NAD(P) transhydrogenase subunit alpha [Tessaracoccus lapidicaptus]